MQEWASLESAGFPAYDISNDGQVKNNRTGRIMKLSTNQEGIVRVGLMRAGESRQVTCSLVRLVARHFVQGRSATFDVPIQLDGDRNNCHANNIMWRPRWFAVKYFQQFDTDEPLFTADIMDVETSTVYENSRIAAQVNGLLEKDILLSVANGSPCFPTWQLFARVSL